jgi:hypothetical protein
MGVRAIKIKNDPFLLFINPQTGKLVNYRIALDATNIGNIRSFSGVYHNFRT